MQNSLQLHVTLMSQLREWLPEERITRLRNLPWLMTGLFLARSAHLSHITGSIKSILPHAAFFLQDCTDITASTAGAGCQFDGPTSTFVGQLQG
jgi:hypothetical protein